MKKIGITGSLSSGKTTASKILSYRKGPLFSADNEVKKIYKKNNLKKIISKKLNLRNYKNLRTVLRNKIINGDLNIKKVESVIHPIIRKEMHDFLKKNMKKRTLFFEIPLLIESKLMKKFDLIIFIKARKSVRLKRFKLKGGSQKLFNILDKKQLNDTKKIKYCDHVVVNENNLKILKKNLSNIII